MYRFFVGLFAIIGLIVVLVAGSAGYLLYRSLGQEEALPETIVLDLDLDRSLIEDVPADPILGPLLGRETSLRDIVDALDRGRGDPRVKGVIARFGGDQISYAQAQELRAAVERFRAAGRFAVAFSESFGELSPGDRSYYLASGFDEIWLQPVGMVGLTGVNAQVPFARGTLDELNLQPQLKQRKEYKSFMNSITEHGFTEPHREMMEALVGDLTEQLVAGVAAGRKLEPAAVHSLIDRGPFLDREAVDAGLIDHLGHYDAARAAAEKRAGSGAGRIEAADYLDRAGRPHSEGSTIALIYGVGSITRGDNGIDPLFGGASMGSEDMRKAFEQAVAAPDVEAILFRIDSGGGSAVASETIRRAVQQAREAGKPVIVSMGEKAASGGYWVAMSADRIVAQPATLTGSIGVVAGKIVTEGLWDRIGMNWEQVTRGQHATIWSPLTPYTDDEQARLDAMLDRIYDAFVRQVAEARRLPLETVQDIAKGRVWTGSQAKALGLVDELGGLDTALDLAREAAGLPPDRSVHLSLYPKPESALDRALSVALGRSRSADTTLARLEGWAKLLAPLVSEPGGELLRMPSTGLSR
jgi:protease-4